MPKDSGMHPFRSPSLYGFGPKKPDELLAELPDQVVFFGNGRFFLIAGMDMEPSLWYEAGAKTTTCRETAPCPCVRVHQMPGGTSRGNFRRPSPGRSARWA